MYMTQDDLETKLDIIGDPDLYLLEATKNKANFVSKYLVDLHGNFLFVPLEEVCRAIPYLDLLQDESVSLRPTNTNKES